MLGLPLRHRRKNHPHHRGPHPPPVHIQHPRCGTFVVLPRDYFLVLVDVHGCMLEPFLQISWRDLSGSFLCRDLETSYPAAAIVDLYPPFGEERQIAERLVRVRVLFLFLPRANSRFLETSFHVQIGDSTRLFFFFFWMIGGLFCSILNGFIGKICFSVSHLLEYSASWSRHHFPVVQLATTIFYLYAAQTIQHSNPSVRTSIAVHLLGQRAVAY